ncbi:MAG: galactokinase [Armatimonadota bacterium]|nr:galactokinase [Armatimonadota bacterium]MDR7437608.1 galactokinase [Armatimonadota bacterium]MDR7472628.1 galactokinase [Armatimonadota bacterium]MDR7509083.1 galactokinase [Armatimonadota bacterium]MDR7517654.1 galactokinase [Armatimonadota bacterium]
MGSPLTDDAVAAAFAARFGGPPAVVARAPGRVNLIGEHTDYNDGLVLPAAIGRHVRIAARPSGTDLVRLAAVLYGETAEFPASDPGRPAVPPWARYPQGVAVKMADRGIRLRGVDALIDADLPVGAGLSSSAALEVAAALVFEHASGQGLAARERALLCRAAEVEWVGVPCGIMDQFAAALCRRGHALFIDCRSLETHHIPLPADLVLAVCDTGVSRALAASAYARRRQECAQAVRALARMGLPVRSLRDLTSDDLPAVERLPDPLRRRARHVVTENARVVEAARLLEGGQADGLREVFAASHRSLREDYEVSSAELDAMVQAALDAPGCVAARMTGAGFGGAVVALVRRGHGEAFLAAVVDGYRRRTGRDGSAFLTEATDGASLRGWRTSLR